MFGNCATGRLAIATAPTMTVRIAITIATIGRLIKNLDISVALHERFRVNLHAGTNLLDALGHHTLARLQSVGDDPHGSDLVAELHCLNCHLVGAVYHGDLISALEFYNSAL